MVYDVTNRESFDCLSLWMNEVEDYGNEGLKIILCGNKIDLQDGRQVTYEEGENWAETRGLDFFETSAKTNEEGCVDHAFQMLIDNLADTVVKPARESFINDMMRHRATTLQMVKVEDKKGCCSG